MSELPRGRALRLVGTIAAAVLVLDQGSKWIAVHTLAGKGTVDVLGGLFHLQLYRNFAGPANSFAGHTVLISVFTVVAVIGLAALAMQVRTLSAAVAVGLLLGGGLGNGLDRVLRDPGPFQGGVVDWLKPTLDGGSMNLADLSLNLAIAAFLVGAALEWWRDRRARPHPA
jgi:signal peptidase II